MPKSQLPYLLRNFTGTGGAIKQRPEDFFVQEIPLYEPSGEGEHVYCEIQKVGLTTFDAINRIADYCNISSREIGYAGMKDAQAVTRQVLSVPRVLPERLMELKTEQLSVLWAARHGNKLRLGHLSGNRFAIKVRDVKPTDVVRLRPAVNELSRRGMANYFGEQRFGRRDNNDKLGAALIAGKHEELLRELLADESDWGPMERHVKARLNKTSNPAAAVGSIDQKIRRLWISALQSRVFNLVAARRVESNALDRLIDGDLAMKHANGACFAVTDAPAEQPRCEAFEISPTGPMIGYRMTEPKGEALRIERDVLESFGLNAESFRATKERAEGARRALRVQPKEIELAAGVDEHGPQITVAFTLPPGSYATVFLRELMRNDSVALE